LCHLADKRTRPPNGRYWTNSGQTPVFGMIG
jgi:hypothetical protein